MSWVLRICTCKPCKKVRRTHGLILGSRLQRHFREGFYVSDYVPYHRWKSGRRPLPKFKHY